MNAWKRLWKFLIVFLASLMLVAGTEAATSSPKSKPLVGFENGRLSVQARDVPLKDLLSEIEARSGIAIELKDSNNAPKWFSVDVKNLPPALAFQGILQHLNFAFFYSGTRLVRVLILPTGNQTPEARSGSMETNPIGQRFSGAETAPVEFRASPTAPRPDRKDSDVPAKLEAIQAMEDSDDPKSIAALGEALIDRERKVKEAALQALAQTKGTNVTEMLSRGLNDSDPEFRLEVLEVLADRGDLDSLRKALADRHPNVRETAADLLWNATTQK
jgi:hypothetical protein